MSNATPSSSERDPRLYVEDMLAFCETALVYTRGLTQAAFTADRMCYDATLRNVELLGEIASDLPRVQDSLRALLQRLPPGQA